MRRLTDFFFDIGCRAEASLMIMDLAMMGGGMNEAMMGGGSDDEWQVYRYF